MLPRDAMHKFGLCRHAVSVRVSVRLSVTFVDHVKTNKHIPFGWPHHSSLSVQNGVAKFRLKPHNGGVECRWGIGRNRDSGLIAGYRRLLDVRSAKSIYRRRSEYMTQSATHHWLSVDCWTCELRSDKNSYRPSCSVDRTVGDAPANVCL